MSNPPPGQWPAPPPPSGSPPWSQQPPGAPRGGNGGKWLLGGLALLVVVVITVVATLVIARDGSSPSTTPTASAPPRTSVASPGIASASDDGPIGVITEDPTCAAWTPIRDTFAAQAQKGWDDRDPSIPASSWTPEQRTQHEAIANAMRSAADQAVALVKLTPHRVMRELYEQSIAYWRAYAEQVPTYVPTDDHLARTATGTSNALVWICSSIAYGSAASRAPLTLPSPAPLQIQPPGDPSRPERYVTEPLSVCAQWIETAGAFDDQTLEWLGTDPNLSVDQWSPDQRAVWASVSSVMSKNANAIQDLGIRSANSIFDDFATLAAAYRRAFVQSFPTYVPADGLLANAAAQLVAANDQACKAAGID